MASPEKFKTCHFNLHLINFHSFRQNNQGKKTLFLGLPWAREKNGTLKPIKDIKTDNYTMHKIESTDSKL